MNDETQPVRPVGAPVDQPADAPAAPGTPAAPAAPAETPAATAETPVVATPAAAPAGWEGRRGFRERFRRLRTSSDGGSRTFGLAALIASALAGVIVGGLGLTAVQAMTHDHDGRPDWSQRQGPMGRDLGGGPGDRGDDRRGPMFGGPGGAPAPVPADHPARGRRRPGPRPGRRSS